MYISIFNFRNSCQVSKMCVRVTQCEINGLRSEEAHACDLFTEYVSVYPVIIGMSPLSHITLLPNNFTPTLQTNSQRNVLLPLYVERK